MSLFKANVKTVSREAVDPARWSKLENPVTREDLGAHFRSCVQLCTDPRNPRTNQLYLDHGQLGDALHAPCAFLYRPGEEEKSEIADFGANDPADDVCRETVREWVRRNLYLLDIWGFFPYAGADDMPDAFVPAATHQWLMENGGRLFGGHDVGEQDGRYLGQFANTARPKRDEESAYEYYCDQIQAFGRLETNFQKHLMVNRFKDRRDAYRGFRRWMRAFEDGMHQCLHPTVHTQWAHYHCELEGARMLGAELALILINHQVAFAFMRGASRQYGALFSTIMSVWSRWGVSHPSDSGETCRPEDGHEMGIGTGTPTHLARRIWYLAYMYGVSVHAIESGTFTRPPDEYVSGKVAEPPPLSELGQLQVDGWDWCTRHPGRGVQYNPVAVMLDFYNGWLAPKHSYQYLGERRLVWNAFPYEKGDHQIDNFFRWVFPGYEEGSYLRDGTGTFVPTPFGDIFDVLLSNADPDVLARYSAIVMLGQDGEVTPALKDYVRAGGDLVVGCNHIVGHDGPFFGVRVTGRRFTSTKSRRAGKECDETPYTHHEVETIGAEVLLESGEGHPLVTVNPYGDGRVIVVAADYWMTDLQEREREVGPASQNVADRNPERTFAHRTEFFDERNWDCPYNGAIKRRIMAGATLATIEKEVCVHCQVPCTNDVSRQCDILEGVKDVLGEYLAGYMPFTVDGPPIHHVANVTDDPSKIIVTLANHADAVWEGGIRFKNASLGVSQVTEWMEDRPARIENIRIPAREVRIFEIATDAPPFADENGDAR